jgi:hypothetical protein
MAWKRAVSGDLAVAAMGALAACGSGGGAASGEGSGLEAALSRLADTSNNRSLITYDDTAVLVKLTGNIISGSGYAPLIGNGVGELMADASTVQSLARINLLGERYGISAGQPPASVGVVAGGQNAASRGRVPARPPATSRPFARPFPTAPRRSSANAGPRSCTMRLSPLLAGARMWWSGGRRPRKAS